MAKRRKKKTPTVRPTSAPIVRPTRARIVRPTSAPVVRDVVADDLSDAGPTPVITVSEPAAVPDSVTDLTVVTPPSAGVLTKPPSIRLLNLPVETLSEIVTFSFCVDFKARSNLLQTSQSMKEIVKSPHVTRSFAIHQWGNSTHAIMSVERRRLKTRDSCTNAFLDPMNDIAAGIDYEDPAEVERLRKCRSYLFIGTVLAPVRMHLATFAIAILVLQPKGERLPRYHEETRDLVIPFLQQLALWRDVVAHADEYRRHTKAYLSILSHHKGNEVWFEQAVLADSYLLNDPAVTARIVELGDYKHFEREEAKKLYAETEYRSLESYRTGKTVTKNESSAQSNNTIEQIKELQEGQRLQEQRLVTVERSAETNSQTLTQINEASAAHNEQIQDMRRIVAESKEDNKAEITRLEVKYDHEHASQSERFGTLEVEVTEVKQTVESTKKDVTRVDKEIARVDKEIARVDKKNDEKHRVVNKRLGTVEESVRTVQVSSTLPERKCKRVKKEVH